MSTQNGLNQNAIDWEYQIVYQRGIEGLSCGYDFGEAVTHEYHAPFRFSGLLEQVMVDVFGDLIEDDEAKVRILMAQQ